MPVDTRHPQYEDNLGLWTMCEDAAEGEHVVHSRGIKYLPKLHEEKPQDYEARKNRTPFFNATWRTISGLKGLIFRKAPQVEFPAGIADYLDDVDMTGRTLNLFAQALTEQVLKVGRAGVLVDHPPLPLDVNGDPLSVAAAEALGLRPYMTMYNAKQIINWKTARIRNVTKLSLVVLEEAADAAADDEFGHGGEIRYRVLDLFGGVYRQRLFRKSENGQDELLSETFPRMRGNPLTEIPFVFVGVDDLSPSVDSPPLLDLAQMNFHHYAVSADYEHGCHFSGLPTLFVTGLQSSADDPDANVIYIGGAAANLLPNPECQAFYAEVSQGFDALRGNLDAKKAEMAILGARMLETSKAAVESAETLEQRVNGEQSTLAAMANVISIALTKALEYLVAWSGTSGEASLALNTDYVPAGMSAQELTALVSAWQSGAISDQTLFFNLQRGEVISGEDTFEEEQERIRSRGLTGE